MGVDKEEVEYLAKLSRVKLDAEEMQFMAKQLDRIIEYVDQLREVNVEGVEPTSFAVETKNVFRKDEVIPDSQVARNLLRHAPSRKDNFFKVPPVID